MLRWLRRIFAPWAEAGELRRHVERLEAQLTACERIAIGRPPSSPVLRPHQYSWSDAYAAVLELRRRYERITSGLVKHDPSSVARAVANSLAEAARNKKS